MVNLFQGLQPQVQEVIFRKEPVGLLQGGFDSVSLEKVTERNMPRFYSSSLPTISANLFSKVRMPTFSFVKEKPAFELFVPANKEQILARIHTGKQKTLAWVGFNYSVVESSDLCIPVRADTLPAFAGDSSFFERKFVSCKFKNNKNNKNYFRNYYLADYEATLWDRHAPFKYDDFWGIPYECEEDAPICFSIQHDIPNGIIINSLFVAAFAEEDIIHGPNWCLDSTGIRVNLEKRTK